MPAVSAIIALLRADGDITSDPFLGSYDFGSGAEPAIFSNVRSEITDAVSGYIRVQQIGGDQSIGTDRSHKGGEFNIDVTVWGPKSYSDKKTREFAFLVWNTLNRAELPSTSKWELCYCFASPPSFLEDPDGFPGYVTSCRVLIREKPGSGS